MFQAQQCYPGKEVPLIAPPSLDPHPTVLSTSALADLDFLSFPPILDEQFLAEYRETSKLKVVLIGEKEIPVLNPIVNSGPLGPPLGFCPPGDWLTEHLNQGVLKSYLHDLQVRMAIGGGYFSGKAIETGRKVWQLAKFKQT